MEGRLAQTRMNLSLPSSETCKPWPTPNIPSLELLQHLWSQSCMPAILTPSMAKVLCSTLPPTFSLGPPHLATLPL